ncbi:uncharacterized protein LOC125042787 [Penaeus chinensis]|uniref:uncharacterized protein LOC125042787 n=1 Tax=Penaeus chinensis TaxID=139456 RepID=UPI001FB6D8FE|nr:uncharacterized protein LOC125042787 [Penaeus chinensis]
MRSAVICVAFAMAMMFPHDGAAIPPDYKDGMALTSRRVDYPDDFDDYFLRIRRSLDDPDDLDDYFLRIRRSIDYPDEGAFTSTESEEPSDTRVPKRRFFIHSATKYGRAKRSMYGEHE